jgi:F420-dependent oxidoreductase-like protein
MRIGLQVPNFSWPPEQVTLGDRFGLIAERAEWAGLYSFWVMDHFFQIAHIGPPEHEMLEGWSALAFAAGRTNRLRLGTMVTGVTYRHPGLLVKTATTLDVLSNGRAYFGIGAAWNEQEHLGLGVPFPPVSERFERLEETLRIARQMWSGDETPFAGKYYQLQRPLNSPGSQQRPHPLILIGGSGERKTLRLVAQYADACNLFARMGVDVVKQKLDVLREHCHVVGRNYWDIEKTTLDTVQLSRSGGEGTSTAEELLERLRALADVGVEHAIFNMPNVHEIEPFEILRDEVVPAATLISPTSA